MIALGLEAGATTVHHELRPLLPWDRALRPDDLAADPLHGVWHAGALRTGKYQEFCQEDPFVTYHPEHSSKWAPHEFLHRAMGFFHREDASGFEQYVGARLNELLPVATWYGLEHALRLDAEGPFDRVAEGRRPGASIDRARWLTDAPRVLRARARAAAPLLRWTLARTARELDAIDREVATGAIVATTTEGGDVVPGVSLDASSDALAYVHAHRARLTSPAVARTLAMLAPLRHARLATLRERVDVVLDRLLFDELELDAGNVAARIAAHVPLDAFLRVATHDIAAFARIAPQLDDARAVQSRVLRGGAREGEAEALVALLGAKLTRGRAAALLALGRAPHVDDRALREGLRAVLPVTAASLGRRASAVVQALVSSGQLVARSPLAERVAGVLRSADVLRDENERAVLSDLARLEGELEARPTHEPRASWRASLSDVLAHGGYATLDRRFRIVRFECDALAAHRGEPVALGASAVALGEVDGERVLVGVPGDLASWLTSIAEAPVRVDRRLVRSVGEETLAGLVELGVVLVFRAPKA